MRCTHSYTLQTPVTLIHCNLRGLQQLISGVGDSDTGKGRPNCMWERSSRSGMASSRRLTGYKAPSPPPTFVSRPLSFYCTRQLTNGPLSSPPCSLAPVSGAPLASCGATSRPLQSPFGLRLTHHMPAASCSHSTTLRHLVASAACN